MKTARAKKKDRKKKRGEGGETMKGTSKSLKKDQEVGIVKHLH